MTFNVLTWNIKVLDAIYPRYHTIADQICDSQAEVVCLQEVSVIGWYYMCDILKNKYMSVFDSPLRANSSSRAYGEMILVKHGSFEISDKGFFLLPSKMGRTVQWACLTNASGDKCVIATGHLESESYNNNARSAQWNKITKEFSSLTSPLIWAGDTNMEKEETGPSYGDLSSFGNTYFGHRFGYEGTGEYDRVWTLGKKATLSDRIGFDPDTTLPLSDHDGLLVTIQ